MKTLQRMLILSIMPMAYVYAHGSNWHMMDWSHMYFGSGGAIMIIALLILVAIGAYFIIKNKHLIKVDEEETPLGILQKRYARGEISKQEFEKVKKDLE